MILLDLNVEILPQIIITTVSALVGFLIGIFNNKLNIKRNIRKDKLDKLYIPFVRLYDSTHMCAAYDFYDFSGEIQKKYVELLIDNMVYTNEFTRNYIFQFVMYYNLLINNKKLEDDDIISINKNFNTISYLMFEEFHYLENKLYYGITERIRNLIVKNKYSKYLKNENTKNCLEDNLS